MSHAVEGRVMRRARLAKVAAIAVGAAGAAWGWVAIGPIPQDAAYVVFADRRALLGVPNGLDVLSNLSFAVVGVAGLFMIARDSGTGTPFLHQWDRWPYAALFLGALLTTVGSSWFHLAPDNARLVWDRLPMTIGFIGLLTAVVSERIGVRVARLLFIPFLVLGAASVVYWYWTELHGAGDLRPYGLVQFGSLAAVTALLARYPRRAPGTAYLWTGLGAYVAAKAFEAADAWVYGLGQIVSGHTLKHLTAALAIGCVLAMFRARGEPGGERPPGQGRPV
jgi:hypothetical protein